jgi:hypothetical protein
MLVMLGAKASPRRQSLANLFPLRLECLIIAEKRTTAPNHTTANAATIGCKRGTAFQSTGAGRLDKRLQYRTCSTGIRRCKAICPLCGATSRKAGIGCAAAPMRWVSGLPQARDLEL